MALLLADKVAIVTGGSRGLGADMAVALAKAGAKVAIIYTSQKSTATANDIVNQINSLDINSNSQSPSALAIQADLCDPSSFPKIISQSITLSPESSTVNIIVNNAAIQIGLPVSEITEKEFTDTYTLNVLAPMLLLKAALPHLAPNSRIINMSSVGGRSGFGGLSLYCSSKAALEGLTRSWAGELGGNGTTVNAIACGPIQTDMLDSIPEKIKGRQKEDTPVEQRFGRKDEVSDVVVCRMFPGTGMGPAPGVDAPAIDNSETVYISSLALLKMLRHGRAGVPMEVMGLMLGEFVDDYTVRVVDVFAMPQSGTGVSVEAVDPVFQTKMMDMLRQTGRHETVVGWYHSHPGFGCWLSSVDINTQQSFEQLTPRAVAVVIDPIQSVKGKVVIDAFRLINPQSLMMGQEPRQSTSNLGYLQKPSVQALVHGLNRHYYSIAINYRKTPLEENMLMNLHKNVWTAALEMPDFKKADEENVGRMEKMVGLAEAYTKRVEEEGGLSSQELKTRYVGKLDPKKHLEDVGKRGIEENIVTALVGMVDRQAGLSCASGINAVKEEDDRMED
ncbi:hypothetical protein ABW20_dc0105560 [Dactylellina cionopaga]|nr:hypothetical protein ABW20_dc0105560 [Dactylellina cionopaga]